MVNSEGDSDRTDIAQIKPHFVTRQLVYFLTSSKFYFTHPSFDFFFNCLRNLLLSNFLSVGMFFEEGFAAVFIEI